MFSIIRLKDNNNNQYDIVPRNDTLHKINTETIDITANDGDILRGAQIFSNYQKNKKVGINEIDNLSLDIVNEVTNSPYILMLLSCDVKRYINVINHMNVMLKLDYTSSDEDNILFRGYKNIIIPESLNVPLLDAMLYADVSAGQKTNPGDNGYIKFEFESALPTETEFDSLVVKNVNAIYVPNMNLGFLN